MYACLVYLGGIWVALGWHLGGMWVASGRRANALERAPSLRAGREALERNPSPSTTDSFSK